jgi:hypothetical protein
MRFEECNGYREFAFILQSREDPPNNLFGEFLKTGSKLMTLDRKLTVFKTKHHVQGRVGSASHSTPRTSSGLQGQTIDETSPTPLTVVLNWTTS